jgi:predicted dehydrogenase
MASGRRTVGLVGCGRWGRHILRDLLSLGCEVTVVDRSEESRELARARGAVAVVDSPAALPAVAGVVVATPTTTHAAVIEELLDRGVPIYVEKPLTADRASAGALARMAPERLFVMDKWRYHPGVQMLAEIARSGELGPTLGLRTTRVQWGHFHGDVDAVWTLAPHDLSIVLAVLGEIPAPRSAVAERVGRAAVGLVGMLGDDPWQVLEVSTRHPDKRREIRLQCRDGVAVVDDDAGDHVRVVRPGGVHDGGVPQVERRPVSTELPLLREVRAFVDHLDGGPPPLSSAADGAAIVDALATLRELAGLDRSGGGR